MLCKPALYFCKSGTQVFHTFFERNALLFFSVILCLDLVIATFEKILFFFDLAIFCFKFKVFFYAY